MPFLPVFPLRFRLVLGVLGLLAPATGADREGDRLYSSEWARRDAATVEKAEPKAERQMGTGFFISSDGILLTAAHVVEGCETITVVTAHGEFEAEVLKRVVETDVAVLRCKVDGLEVAPLPLATHSADVRFGASVFTVGFPNPPILGKQPKLAKGEVCSLAGLQDHPRFWQTSVPALYGNSGGPLVDEEGRVIGMIASKINGLQAARSFGDIPALLTYALKGIYLRPALDSLGIEFHTQSTLEPPLSFVEVAERVRDSVVLVIAE